MPFVRAPVLVDPACKQQIVITPSQDHGHTVVNRPHQFIGLRGDDCERHHPLPVRVLNSLIVFHLGLFLICCEIVMNKFVC
jgi:hypothetical protein